jgi:hypothetical protein
MDVPARPFRLFRRHDPALLIVSAGLVAALFVFGTRAQSAILQLGAGLLAYVHGTFFFFCNIFHIRRWKELTWGALFVGGFLACQLRLDPFRALVLWGAAMAVVSAILCLSESRRGDYHGHPWFAPRRR